MDQSDHPLQVGPIHRSVSALTLSDLQDVSAERGDGFDTVADREAAFSLWAARCGDTTHTSFVVSDGRAWAVLRTKRTSPVDAAVLHEALLPPGEQRRSRSATTTASTRRCTRRHASPGSWWPCTRRRSPQ